MKAQLLDLVGDGTVPKPGAGLFRSLIILSAMTATLMACLATVDGLLADFGALPNLLDQGAVGILALDYLLRLAHAVARRPVGTPILAALRRYGLSVYGLFDFMAVVPFYLAQGLALSGDAHTITGVIQFLKLARYSPALETLGAVILNEMKPLQSALYLMLLLALTASTLLYFVERDTNPVGFGSVPQAMWWAIVTLSTVGYGDVIPVTPLGKILGGMVAVLGFGMFALPAGILATGFAEEIRRLNFVTTWNMVSKVPLFEPLDAHLIAEIANLLRVKRCIKGEVVIRQGDPGEAMYFLASGEVKVVSGHHTAGPGVILREGDFFGEIALISDVPRTATVVARGRCQLLELTAQDFRALTLANPRLRTRIEKIAQQRLASLGVPVSSSPTTLPEDL